MAFQKVPSYLYRKAPGKPFYLKLPVPPALQHYYPGAKGRPRTHVVVPLGTSREAEAERLKRPLLADYWAQFKRLEAGQPATAAPVARTHQARLQDIRESMAEARTYDDDGAAVEALQDAAIEIAEDLEKIAEDSENTAGKDAAMQAYRVATAPGRLTLTEALTEWNGGSDVKESTRVKRVQVINELLSFLRVSDCLPEYLTDDRAVAYVNWLNQGKLGYSTKQDRMSTLTVLWAFLVRRRQVPRGSSPWVNHEITKRSTGSVMETEPDKRGWREVEVLKLFSAPDNSDGIRSAHYTRPLFRELYALGFLTGMRLDEIVSLKPSAVEPIAAPKGKNVAGYWLSVEAAKTEAGVRTIPVVHPAAVAILAARLERQKDPAVSVFSECRPGGPDNKLSWHVQKALGRDRDRLDFGPEVDFHSTRRSFLTMMENSGADTVHVQRYVGHKVGTLMHSVYSDGASRESLLKVAKAVRYSEAIEQQLMRR